MNISTARAIVMILLLFAFISFCFAQTWPNEPAGSNLLTDYPFDAVQGNGWIAQYPFGGRIVSDPTAPHSPSNVMEYSRPVNSIGNTSCTRYELNGGKELYIGIWWKPSNPFVGWSNLHNKIFFLWFANGDCFYFSMSGDQRGGPYRTAWNLNLGLSQGHLGNGWGDDPGTWNLYGNINSATVALGQWHRVEVYAKVGSGPTARDGILRWWLDGKLVGTYDQVNFPASTWKTVQFTASWDAPDPTQATPDYHWFDHARISLPNGAPNVMYIPTGSMPAGATGRAYSATLQATGGKAPYGWTITSGSLPQGLSLNKTTGAITGTPISGGKSTFTVKAVDSSVPALEASKTFSIVVSGTAGIGLSPVQNRAVVSGFSSGKVFDSMGRNVSGFKNFSSGGIYFELLDPSRNLVRKSWKDK